MQNQARVAGATEPRSELKEVVAVFADGASFQRAVDDLFTSGFDDGSLSMLAGKEAVVEKLGRGYERIRELEDSPDVPRAEYVPPETVGNAKGGLISGLTYVGATAAAGAIVATGGTALAAVIGAALAGGAGGLAGGALAGWLGRHRATYLQEQIDNGGLLLWVRTPDKDRERMAIAILERNGGRDVHVHSVPDTMLQSSV